MTQQTSSPPTRPVTALGGIRVLDLTQVMSGPYCTMMLGDLGADVIKIEQPGSGDQTRKSWGYAVKGEDSRAFLSLNRNKRSVCLDLKQEGDLQDFYALVAAADVVVENFRPGVAKRLRIDYDTLSSINPRVIYASISGFGQTGPYANYPGYDLIAQAMSGVMSITGEPGGAPVKCGLPVADLGAGLFCTIGILGAVIARGEDGPGQYLETSLFETAVALSVWESTEYWATREVPVALGSANRMSAPYQAIATRDGYVTIGANNEKLWQNLCKAMGAEHFLEDQRFIDNNRRMAHRAELIAALEPVFAEKTTDEWVEILLAEGVPAGPIRNYSQVLDQDPHVKARGMVSFFDHPVEGRLPVLASPLRLHGTPPTIRKAPPLLGEDTEDVLAGIRAHARSSTGSGA
ncbi:CoA transferase [Pseudarthrobacter sp. NamE2]|uniref:CaiB/BaiF CoA transferase family protein n=1 Tax=Pseudarthrobacter sp. NamE2 TaxID=2576838 RepID=UPI0010FDC230|nr:CoA transferase [Pseudarthrobacter sp. NamE2]TLM80985.1 CoA transferase [Pseudarthrobacter sp. NamE2]